MATREGPPSPPPRTASAQSWPGRPRRVPRRALAHPPLEALTGLLPLSFLEASSPWTARLALAPGPLPRQPASARPAGRGSWGPCSSLPGPGTQLVFPHRCTRSGRHGTGCTGARSLPAQTLLALVGSGLRSPSRSPQPLSLPPAAAQASAARNQREHACLCQLRRKQNSLWFVTQIFCLFFLNITKPKTAPPPPLRPPSPRQTDTSVYTGRKTFLAGQPGPLPQAVPSALSGGRGPGAW